MKLKCQGSKQQTISNIHEWQGAVRGSSIPRKPDSARTTKVINQK